MSRNRVREAREREALSMQELADKAWLSVRTIQRVENDEEGAVSRNTKLKLVKAFNSIENRVRQEEYILEYLFPHPDDH